MGSNVVSGGAAPPGRLRALLLLGGITGLGPFSVDTYLPAFPRIATDLSATPSEVQLTLAAYLVAMAVGQLLVGPLSDSWGRRRPVLVALACFLLVSLACALAPTVWLLVILRAAQGLMGGGSAVIARAVVRDLYTGSDVTRFFSRLTLVFGLAPIVAPSIGSLLLALTGWRGIFVMLAVFGAAMLLAVGIGLPETLPAQRRHPPGLSVMIHNMAGLLGDRRYLGYALAQGFGFAGMFSYISGSPFAMQVVYGASATLFGLLFGLNALGFVLASQLSGFLAGRIPERRTLLAALVGGALAGTTLIVVAASRAGGLVAFALALLAYLFALGLVVPNTMSLALARRPEAAGAAAALLGFLQTLIGAVAAPLVGLGPADSAMPMAVAVGGLAAAALLSTLTLARAGSRRDAAMQPS